MAIDGLKSLIKFYEGNSTGYFNFDFINLNEIARSFGLKYVPSINIF